MQTRIVSPRRQRSPASAWIPTTLVLFLVLAQLAMVATAQTFFVDPVAGTNSGTCGASTAAACLTIAQAITRAPSSGGTVALMPGTYTGAGNVGLSWPGKSLTLTSTGGSGATFIDGGASSRIFSLTTETGTISSITVRKGFAQSGGCALINGASTVVRIPTRCVYPVHSDGCWTCTGGRDHWPSRRRSVH
ncbi:hypothetical protein BC828DRAFT_32446 [Blastocladiella britannica]|nr:hypothetical protein BC828DRAFT_32446 [Blastocladiella britannica]